MARRAKRAQEHERAQARKGGQDVCERIHELRVKDRIVYKDDSRVGERRTQKIALDRRNR